VKKEIISMLLAGGQGSRLYALTADAAKPIMPFGGKYRIIDFPLSNCANSGIDTVGVLTQYRPMKLNSYIGSGQAWDLDREDGGVYILPPYMSAGEKGNWFSGTANAIYQNMEFIDQYNAEYVLILSGDHIYHMDYSKMLKFHKEKGADCTIAVLEVTLEEASRFGIMSTHEDGTIYKFTEKPKNPDSTKASMGIYIFNKKKLFDYLNADAADPDSANDFGKNIIPNMLAAGEKMMAYPFEGYWKDVGTIQSLWEANMDLLGEEPVLNVSDESWRIYSRHHAEEPQFVGKTAVIDNSSITEGCEIHGTVKNCVLGSGVRVMYGAYVKDSVILGNTVIGEGATVNYAILDEGVDIGAGAKVGAPRETATDITVIGTGVKVPSGTTIPDGKMISEL